MKFSRRIVYSFLLLGPGLLCQDSPSSLAGTVLDATSKTPLAKVHVQAVPLGQKSDVPYGTDSDTQGRFSFAAIPAGTYTLLLRRAGMVFQRLDPSDPPVPNVSLKAGEQKDMKLGMTRKAVLSGRVTDDAGVPIEFALLQISPTAGYTAGWRYYQQYFTLSMLLRTDDRGEYRVSVPPGKYQIKVSLRGIERNIGISASSGAAFQDTYFPSAPDAKSAQTVEAVAGRETANLNITLNRKLPLSISGVVSGVLSSHATVLAQSSPQGGSFAQTQTDPSGHFTIKNILPGTYMIGALSMADSSSGYDASKQRRSPAMEVRLTDRDITDLTLTIGEMVHLSGHVESSGSSGVLSVKELTFHVANSSIGGRSKTANVDSKGDFEVPEIDADRYIIQLKSEPKSAYLKKVVLNGDTAADQTLDLTRGGGQSQVTLTAAAGSIVRGSVSNSGGLITHRRASVVLEPLNKRNRMDRRRAGLDAHGAYSFEGVPPGKYHLLAIDALASGPVLDDELTIRLAEEAETIEVPEGMGEVVKDLKASASKAGGVTQ